MGVPKPNSRRNSITLRDLFDRAQKPNSQNTLTGTTKLPEPPNSENTLAGVTQLPQPPFINHETQQIISKINACNQIFTFIIPSESHTDRDLKQENLSHILKFISTYKDPLDNQILTPLINMISTNVFVPLPVPTNRYQLFDALEDDLPLITFLPSWPHLEVIYEILLTLVKNLDTRSMKRNGINHKFLSNLVVRFQSEDPRERDKLKTIYHMLYTKLTYQRRFMRKCMNNILLQFALHSTNEQYFGISELLEIYGSIINGFTVPLREEHRVFLKRVLVPLHKPKGLGVYYKQLSYCVIEFVKKEPVLSESVMCGFLRCWPLTNCQKEVFMLGELEELIVVLESKPVQFEKLAVSVASRIAKCINSSNSQVAERALYTWNNEKFVKMTTDLMNEIVPPVVAAIERNLKSHWSKSVQQVTLSVRNLLEGINPSLYCKYVEQFELQELELRKKELERKIIWERIEMDGNL